MSGTPLAKSRSKPPNAKREKDQGKGEEYARLDPLEGPETSLG
jgi:hypothetical protein